MSWSTKHREQPECSPCTYFGASATQTLSCRFGAKTVNEDIVAVLIHKPDHYLRGGDRTRLKGVQAMRVRQLKRMGFKVMQLDSGEIGRRRMCPDTLRALLKDNYYEALSTTKSPTTST